MATIRSKLIALRDSIKNDLYIDDDDGIDEESGKPIIRRVYMEPSETFMQSIIDDLDEIIHTKSTKPKSGDSNSELLSACESKIAGLCAVNNITHRRCQITEKVFKDIKRSGIYSADAIANDKYYVFYQAASRDSIFSGSPYSTISMFSSIVLVSFDPTPTVLVHTHINTIEDVDTFFDEVLKNIT